MFTTFTFIASFIGSAALTKAVLNRVSPQVSKKPLSEYDDIGFTDESGTWVSLMPKGGSFDSEGHVCVGGVRLSDM